MKNGVDQMIGIENEYPFIKIMHECLSKAFKNGKKYIEKELHQLMKEISGLKKLVIKEPKIIVERINSLIIKTERLSNRYDELCGSEDKILAISKKRIEHLRDVQNDQMNDSKTIEEYHITRADRLIIDYLLREGHINAATNYADQLKITEFTDVEVFEETQEIMKDLAEHRSESALNWCNTHKTKLSKLKSSLEMELRMQQFADLVKEGHPIQGIQYARKYFPKFGREYHWKLEKTMMLLAIGDNEEIGNMTDYYKPERWQELSDRFAHTSYHLHSLTTESLMSLTLQAGLSSLKTIFCGDTETLNENCPTCNHLIAQLGKDLPYSTHLHTTLVCKISGHIMDDLNPPLLLPNGHIYSENALTQMAEKHKGKITCQLTKKTYKLSECKKIYFCQYKQISIRQEIRGEEQIINCEDYMVQPNFQISGSKTKLFSTAEHPRSIITGSTNMSGPSHKLMSLLRVMNGTEDEINVFDTFMKENIAHREFKQTHYQTIFLKTIENRLTNQIFMNESNYTHQLRLFQCIRLLSRDIKILDLFFEEGKMEVIAQSLINFAEKHFEDMEEGFVNQILLEVLTILLRILTYTQQDSPTRKRESKMERIGPIISDPKLIETMQHLLSSNNGVILQNILDIMSSIPNMEDISEQFACEYTMGKLLKMIEEFNEDLKMRAIHVLTKIVCDKQARQHYLDLGGPNYLLNELEVTKRAELKMELLSCICRMSEDRSLIREQYRMIDILLIQLQLDEGAIVIVLVLSILTNLCYNDENNYRIRRQASHLIGELLTMHSPKLNPNILAFHSQDPKIDKQTRQEIQLNSLRLLRHLYSLDKNRNSFKLVFPPNLFGVFLDVGNYKRDLNLYSPVLKMLNKLSKAELGEIEINFDKLKAARPMGATMYGYHETSKTINGYTIIEQIGKGAYGNVYEVIKGESKFAIKEIPLSSFSEESAVADEAQRFNVKIYKEVEIFKKLDHPNIIKYYSSFKYADNFYIVMELAKGTTLLNFIGSLLEKGERLSEEEVWEILSQLVAAVGYLHIEMRVVHRDIAPSNIMIEKQKYIKLADFGLAKQRGLQNSMMKSFVGTITYSCPEIVQSQPYTEKADIWSLGCVMYELMMRKPPWVAQNPLTMAKKIVEGTFDPIDPNCYSLELRNIITWAMSADPAKRPSVQQLAESMGPRLLRQIDIVRLRDFNLVKENEELRGKIRMTESRMNNNQMISPKDIMEEEKLEGELKMMKIESNQIKKVIDPVSLIMQIMQKFFFILTLPPSVSRHKKRVILERYINRIFKMKHSTAFLKNEINKLSNESKEFVSGTTEAGLTYQRLNEYINEIVEEYKYASADLQAPNEEQQIFQNFKLN